MLIVYDKTTLECVAVNGIVPYNRNLTEAEKDVQIAEPLPDNYDYYKVMDDDLIAKVWRARYAGIGIRVGLDGDFKPIGVEFDGDVPDVFPEPEPIPAESTTEEILWQTITDLQLDLIATNQALTDAQLEIELLKGGV